MSIEKEIESEFQRDLARPGEKDLDTFSLLGLPGVIIIKALLKRRISRLSA
jgi:hypothetical protein